KPLVGSNPTPSARSAGTAVHHSALSAAIRLDLPTTYRHIRCTTVHHREGTGNGLKCRLECRLQKRQWRGARHPSFDATTGPAGEETALALRRRRALPAERPRLDLSLQDRRPHPDDGAGAAGTRGPGAGARVCAGGAPAALCRYQPI